MTLKKECTLYIVDVFISDISDVEDRYSINTKAKYGYKSAGRAQLKGTSLQKECHFGLGPMSYYSITHSISCCQM